MMNLFTSFITYTRCVNLNPTCNWGQYVYISLVDVLVIYILFTTTYFLLQSILENCVQQKIKERKSLRPLLLMGSLLWWHFCHFSTLQKFQKIPMFVCFKFPIIERTRGGCSLWNQLGVVSWLGWVGLGWVGWLKE